MTRTFRLLAIAAIPVVSVLINGRTSELLPRLLRRPPPPQLSRAVGTAGGPGPAGGIDAELRQGTTAPPLTVPAGAAAVEQRSPGTAPPARLAARFDGMGVGFEGPQGSATLRNPSDNSLAVGPDHIVQIVNSRMAIFTKRGRRYAGTGQALYGPVATNRVFAGFGGRCEARNNGDAVVRYDQLARRWLIVMPIFSRGPERPDQPPVWAASGTAVTSPPGVAGQPGPAARLAALPGDTNPPPPAGRGTVPGEPAPQGPYSMCYAVSAGSDPFGPYYRYEFLRPLFPDYPRPAVWADGYYTPTSTGDEVIQKHICVADRTRMLAGQSATEQCIVIDNVNFLNAADIDGTATPPRGAPAIILAAGGTQLKKDFEDDGLYAWAMHVDWTAPAKTSLTGPVKVPVAPYRYLCDGQLTSCVPQPGSDRRLDAQGDKIMARLVYRKIGNRESLVAVHSVNTAAGGGGVRWYELRVQPDRRVTLHQQGTYAPDGRFRWLATPAMDRKGNIGIGYSFGGADRYAGQRFAARRDGDPKGTLPLAEATLVEGEAAQNALRWQDFTQAAMDPDDDCTIWYSGDYLKKDAANYSSAIGAFQVPGCR